MSVELSIIIVQYKTPELLERCISSIYHYSKNVSVEIIVVNNDLEDNSMNFFVSKFHKVIWLNSGYNAGFSRANNIGIQHATGEYILILNPDTEIKEGFLRQFIDFYIATDEGTLGLLGCRIISSVDHSLLIGSGINFPSISGVVKGNPLFIYFTRSQSASGTKKYDPHIMHYQNHEIDFVSGACVMIRRNKILKDKLFFDEDFFLYAEDIEWSHRIKKAGYKNYFCSEIEVYHVNSASTGSSKAKFFQIQISYYLFYLKAYGLLYYLLIGHILFINFISNLFLLKKANQINEFNTEISRYDVFKKYYMHILKLYYFFRKKNQPYLKYD